MPCTAHMPVPRSQIGSPTEVGGPSGSPVTCMIPPMPCAIRSKPPLGRPIEPHMPASDAKRQLGAGDNGGRLCPIADLRICRWPEPALLLGEPVCQHVDEGAHLGAQMPAMGIERVDFQLLRPVA